MDSDQQRIVRDLRHEHGSAQPRVPVAAAAWKHVVSEITAAQSAAAAQVAALCDLLATTFDPAVMPSMARSFGPAARLLVDAWLREREVRDTDREAILEELAATLTAVIAHAPELESLDTKRTPLSHLFAGLSRRFPHPTTAVMLVAQQFHRALRSLEREMSRQPQFHGKIVRNLSEYCSTAWILVRHGSMEALAEALGPAATLTTAELNTAALDDFASGALARSADTRARHAQTREDHRETAAERLLAIDTTLRKHEQRAKILVGSKPASISPRAPSAAPRDARTPRSRVVEPGRPSGSATEGRSHAPVTIVFVPMPAEARRHGESRLDYARQEDNDPLHTPVHPPANRNVRVDFQAHARINRSLLLASDPSALVPADLCELYDIFERRDREPIGEALFALNLLVRNSSPERLLATRPTHGLPSCVDGWYVHSDSSLLIPYPLLGFVETGESCFGPCRPGGKWIVLPAIRWLRMLARDYQDVLQTLGLWPPVPYFLSLMSYPPQPITEASFNQWLTRVTGNSRLTASRLSRASLWALTARPSRLATALASGRVGFDVQATCAYLNASSRQLVDRITAAAKSLHCAVLDEAKARGVRWPLLENPDLWSLPHDDDEHFGSLVVPDPTAIHARIVAIKDRIRPVSRPISRDELRRRLNVYVLHEWLRYLWHTATRPVADGLLTRSEFRTKPGWALVADKGAADVRLVPLTDECVRLLLRLHDVVRRVLSLCAGWRGFDASDCREDQIFVWIDQDLRVRPFGWAAAERVLADEGLAWDYPFNSARHYHVTRAWDREYLDTMEAFIGHLHEGREPWNRYALGPLELQGEAFRRHAQLIVREVGCEDPGGFFV